MSNQAVEFGYDLKFKIGPYKFFWIKKRHKHLVKSGQGWKRLWIERKNSDGSFTIVYGLRSKT